MFSWDILLNIFGRFLLSFYFLKAGISNALHWSRVLGLLKHKKIPLPHITLAAVVFTQIVGSLAVIFNVYSSLAAIALIIFTLCANIFICNYWTMEGVQKRNVSFIFYANIAVIGGLLLVITQKVSF